MVIFYIFFIEIDRLHCVLSPTDYYYYYYRNISLALFKSPTTMCLLYAISM